jgi:hypothetical protein
MTPIMLYAVVHVSSVSTLDFVAIAQTQVALSVLHGGRAWLEGWLCLCYTYCGDSQDTS